MATNPKEHKGIGRLTAELIDHMGKVDWTEPQFEEPREDDQQTDERLNAPSLTWLM